MGCLGFDCLDLFSNTRSLVLIYISERGKKTLSWFQANASAFAFDSELKEIIGTENCASGTRGVAAFENNHSHFLDANLIRNLTIMFENR